MARHTSRLGGPVFLETSDPEERARGHRKLGYAAAYCPNVALGDTARIQAIAEAFARQNVVIAEVGRWVNLLDDDAQKRAENLKKVTEGLALADEIGALCCVDIAGSYNKKVWYGPDPENLSEKFFEGCEKHKTCPRGMARQHWGQMEKFSEYAFNTSLNDYSTIAHDNSLKYWAITFSNSLSSPVS